MEIKFENNSDILESVSGSIQQDFKINVRSDKSVYLSIEMFYLDSESKISFYDITQNQLSDIIGALLHVQQKVKNRRS